MVGEPASLAVATIARSVMTKLDVLHGEMDAAMNPHRMALRHLGVSDTLGWAKLVYHEEAFRLWTEMLRENPDDLEALHHLAIMHHARAIDLENSPDPARANADWEAALRLWHRLWQVDAFWVRLTEVARAKTSRCSVTEVRTELPVRLLEMHYDIALDLEHTPLRCARYHVQLAQQSPFPSEDRDAARRNVYARFIRSVPDSVWQFHEMDPIILKQGTDRIEQYLARDPGCPPALEDALRLQVRVIRSWHTDLQAAGDENSAKRRSLLCSLKAAADAWREYFDQLVATGGLEAEIRQKLGLWYRVMGDVHCALDKEEQAVEYYEQGVRGTESEDEEHQRCADDLGRTYAYLARERAHRGETGAKAYSDQVAQRDDLTVSACFLLANAYSLLKEFDLAEQVCDRGLTLEPNLTDVDDITSNERDRQRLQEMRQSIGESRRHHRATQLMDRAVEHLKAHRPAQALPLLDQAASVAPQMDAIFFFRCQCHIALSHAKEAAADLKTFRTQLASDADKDTRDALRRLEGDCRRLLEEVTRFGTKALELKKQALEAFASGDLESGLRLIREAAAASSQPAWKKELSVILNGVAVQTFEEIPKLEEGFGEVTKEIMRGVSSIMDGV